MRLRFNNLRRTVVALAGGAILVAGSAGVGLAQKPWKGDKHDLKEHQKMERGALRTHQRAERELYGNARAQREHWKAERSDLKRHEKLEKATFKRNRRTARANTGVHYSTARGYFRDRGRRAYRSRR